MIIDRFVKSLSHITTMMCSHYLLQWWHIGKSNLAPLSKQLHMKLALLVLASSAYMNVLDLNNPSKVPTFEW